jgi:hypothetical protein
MALPLDFIIFGVPRSGTKGLVRALNLHPHIYCAMERFHFRTDHSRLTFPDSYLDPNGRGGRDDHDKIKHIADEIAKKNDVRRAGNKLPRYYFALERVNREIPALRNIWIYRSPFGFVPSWNVREQMTGKGQWPSGQIGLFGVLELLVCIENCLALTKDVLVFPYRQGLGKSTDSVLQTIDFLGAESRLYDVEGFAEMQRKRDEKRRSATPEARGSLRDCEEELLTALHIRDLDELLERGRAFQLSEIAGPLRDFLNSISEVLPNAIDKAFSACADRAVDAFGRDHFNRNRSEFAGLIARARESQVLARFQRFAALPRLKALYHQYLGSQAQRLA